MARGKGVYWMQMITGIGIGLILAALVWIFMGQESVGESTPTRQAKREIVLYNQRDFNLDNFPLQLPGIAIKDPKEDLATNQMIVEGYTNRIADLEMPTTVTEAIEDSQASDVSIATESPEVAGPEELSVATTKPTDPVLAKADEDGSQQEIGSTSQPINKLEKEVENRNEPIVTDAPDHEVTAEVGVENETAPESDLEPDVQIGTTDPADAPGYPTQLESNVDLEATDEDENPTRSDKEDSVESVEVVIMMGDRADDIARRLAKQGLITDEDDFIAEVSQRGLDRKLWAGRYQIPVDANIEVIIDSLTR